MTVSYSRNFLKRAKRLDAKLRQRLTERIALFMTNPLDPQLRDHALKGRYKGYRSIDVTGDYRVLYLLRGDEAVFDDIGTHSQLYG